MQTGLPPWHLWGNSQQVNLVSNGTSISRTESQLVRIAYARPETWRFFFAAQIVDGVTVGGGEVIVDYLVTIGVGRAAFTMQPFPRLHFFWAAAAPIGQQIFTSSVDGPVKDSAFPTRPNVIETISAQDIQVRGNVTFTSGTAGDRIGVGVHAFFSPETHIRPEWLMRQFPGGEQQGH